MKRTAPITDQERKNRSNATRKLWKNKKWRQKNISSQVAYWSNESSHIKHSMIMKKVGESDELRRKRSESAKKQWENDEYRKLVIRSSRKQMIDLWKDRTRASDRARLIVKGLKRSPNKPESVCGNILEELFPGQYAFVGDGKLIVGGYCPDYANINGQKKLIEVYGDYWHKDDNPQERIDYFSQFGYKTIVLWEKEILSDRLIVEQKLRVFHNE